MPNVLKLELEVAGGAIYIWEKVEGKNNTTGYWLRGRHDLGMD